MSAPNQLSLEILIKTIADARGITTTNQQIQGLADSMRQASAAGKPLETSADSIAGALLKSGKAAGTLSEAGKAAGKTLGELNRAGAGASLILNGLEQAAQGGIRGVIGLGNATRGFITVARTAIASTGPVGILVTVLGLAAGAFMALRGRTKEAGDEFDKTKGKVDGANKALEEASARAADTEKKLKELAEQGLSEAGAKAKELEDRFNKATEAIKRTAEAAAKVRVAETDLEIARIDAAEAKGDLSKEAAAAARFTVQRAAARGDLRAQQQLAGELITVENARIDAARGAVDEKAREGEQLAKFQNQALDRRTELRGQLGQVRDAARVARESREAEIEDLKKQRSLLIASGDPVADRGLSGRQRELDSKIATAEAALAKEQAAFAGQVTPLAKEIDAVDAELASLNESLAQANAALQGFRDTLQTVSKQAGERTATIASDIDTTTTVAAIREQAQALRNPQMTKVADDLSRRAVNSGGTILTRDGRSIEVAGRVNLGGTSGGVITTSGGRRLEVAGTPSTDGVSAAIRAAGADAAAKIEQMGRETVVTIKKVEDAADRTKRQLLNSRQGGGF
jgi:hypothetical protein